jgi:hypothetical protein
MLATLYSERNGTNPISGKFLICPLQSRPAANFVGRNEPNFGGILKPHRSQSGPHATNFSERNEPNFRKIPDPPAPELTRHKFLGRNEPNFGCQPGCSPEPPTGGTTKLVKRSQSRAIGQVFLIPVTGIAAFAYNYIVNSRAPRNCASSGEAAEFRTNIGALRTKFERRGAAKAFVVPDRWTISWTKPAHTQHAAVSPRREKRPASGVQMRGICGRIDVRSVRVKDQVSG